MTVATLAMTASAQAGTYEVTACAGGANASWAPFRSNDAFELVPGCPLRALSTTSPNRRAGFFEAAWWRLTAPPGTVIDRLRITRWGRRFSQRDGEVVGGVPQGGWVSEAYTEDGVITYGFGREGCTVMPNNIGCEWGSRTTPVNLDLDAGQVTYQVACIVSSGCDTSNNAGVPFAELTIYNAVATIRDDVAPTLSAGGPLLAGGWRRPGDELVVDAADTTGISAIEAGQSRLAPACNYTKTTPCGSVVGARLTVGGLRDGAQTLTITARDAAQNPSTVTRTVNVDGTAPSAVLQPPRGRTIVVKVADELSGVAGGQISVGGTPLPSTLARGLLRARLPNGNPRRADVRVTVTDNAGNTASGLPPRLSVPSRIRARHGRATTLRGRLTTPAGQPLAGVAVQATSTIRRRGEIAQPIPGTTTDARGRFRLRAPAGPSRTIRVIVPAAGEVLRAARGVFVRVPASSSIHASRRVVSAGTRVRFSGTIRRAGQPIPRRGLVVILQGRSAGAWRTFADTRTTRSGRWRASYVFRGVPGRYPVRVRIRRQSGFPFELGYSPATTIRVRG